MHARALTDWPYPFWIAHRGAGKLAPENTLAAFRVGATQGFRAFECDVKLSADEVPFLLHDATLERTTGVSGLAGGRSWDALSRLDAGSWHGPAFAGEPLPRLAAIADFVLAQDFALNLELKPTPGCERRTGIVVALEVARLWVAARVPPLLSSFQPEALKGAFDAAAALPRALLLDALRPCWLEAAQALGCCAVITDHRLMGTVLVRTLHQAGLRALAYTVNDDATARALIDAGIDGLITDAVDRFKPADPARLADPVGR